MCKAIDDLIEDRAKELSEEYEIIIAALQKELEEHKKQKAKSMLEIEQLKARLDALV